MNLDDMKDRWTEYDRKLDAVLKHQETSRLRSRLEANADSALRGESRSILAGQVMNIAGVAVLGLFIAANVGEMRYVLPAALLDATLIAFIVLGAYRRAAYNAIDFSEPVVALQTRLQQLRTLRIHESRAIGLFAPLLWTPLLIVGLKGVFGVDAYAALGSAWLWANVALGIAWIPLVWWASRHWAGVFRDSPKLAGWLDDVAGRSLNDARGYLDRLAGVENDDPR